MKASSENYRGRQGNATSRKLSKECQAEVEAPGGVEPPTNGLGNRCSIQLSYGASLPCHSSL